ncbi:hypothetical protein B0J13DRAFT_530663 [Dactylonectria estremocensis]|uniref:DUF6606 domain-containing protein n=1 Tax=Dactylonectria estremocensis TaxID=1079267 RepID=A0A9P9IMI5_9HYPO|nr:hypothetical protein B0J13DRAFT_530663 [Dactylonectria estremocensis]
MAEFLDYLFRHFFLPRKLPDEHDGCPERESAMIDFVLTSLRVFDGEGDLICRPGIWAAISALQSIECARDPNGYLLGDGVREVLHDLALYNRAFEDAFVSTIVTMSHQVAKEMKPDVKKAHQFHVENQDTTNPHIVTELLMSMHRGIGKQVDVTGVCKNTHDELTMSRAAADSGALYKRFMIFLLARLLEVANKESASSSVLQPMSMKISRRLLKLERPQGGKWLTTVQRILSETSELLEKRWEEIGDQPKDSLGLAAVAELDMKSAINHTLPEMEQFLLSVQQRKIMSASTLFRPTSLFQHLDAMELPCVSKMTDPETLPFHLSEIELWVATRLNAWLESHLGDEFSCRDLSTLFLDYHQAGTEWYSSRPEGVSRMFLTTLELWVAADKATIHAIPILRNYDPEVPLELFQALLLSFNRDMDRLCRVETYVMERRIFAKRQQRPSVFLSHGHKDSFQVEYFSKSTTHQALMKRIVNDATVEKKNLHQRLMQEYDETECETAEIERGGLEFSEHSPNCSRCKLLTKAKNLTIDVHEWPLSEHDAKAQTTVFELDVPPVFCEWRHLTLYFLDNVLQCCEKGSDPPPAMLYLQSYKGLSKYAKWEGQSRVRLMSDWAAHTSTHRLSKAISFIHESEVYIENGLRFRYFDFTKKCFLFHFTLSMVLSELCTLKLPARSQELQRFLVRTHADPNGGTPNQAIANQSKSIELPKAHVTGRVQGFGCPALWAFTTVDECTHTTRDVNG